MTNETETKPKKPIWKKWWFLITFLSLLFILVEILFMGLIISLSLPENQVSNLISILVFLSLIIGILMILKVRFLDKETTGIVALLMLPGYFFQGTMFGMITGQGFFIFGIAWIIKSIKGKSGVISRLLE